MRSPRRALFSIISDASSMPADFSSMRSYASRVKARRPHWLSPKRDA